MYRILKKFGTWLRTRPTHLTNVTHYLVKYRPLSSDHTYIIPPKWIVLKTVDGYIVSQQVNFRQATMQELLIKLSSLFHNYRLLYPPCCSDIQPMSQKVNNSVKSRLNFRKFCRIVAHPVVSEIQLLVEFLTMP